MIQARIEPATEADIPLVYETWLRNYWGVNAKHTRARRPLCHMDIELYFAEQRRLIDRLLERSIVLVARDPDDEVLRYGWIAFEQSPPTLHYVYVKYPIRSTATCRRGLGTQLMEAFHPGFGKDMFFYTHQTYSMSFLKDKWKGIYNPYILMEGHSNGDFSSGHEAEAVRGTAEQRR